MNLEFLKKIDSLSFLTEKRTLIQDFRATKRVKLAMVTGRQ